MSKKIKLSDKDYRTIRESAQEAYMELKKGSRDTDETYTAKVWTEAVIGNLNRLGLVDFKLDLEEIPYESVED